MWDKIKNVKESFFEDDEEKKTEEKNEQSSKSQTRPKSFLSNFVNIEINKSKIFEAIGSGNYGSAINVNLTPMGKFALGVIGGGILLYIFWKGRNK